jgi:hypothetical protein
MRADILIGILIINLCELFCQIPFDALLLKDFKTNKRSIERNIYFH